MNKRNDDKKKAREVKPHEPWELEHQTEGLDTLQGERMKRDDKQSSWQKNKREE